MLMRNLFFCTIACSVPLAAMEQGLEKYKEEQLWVDNEQQQSQSVSTRNQTQQKLQLIIDNLSETITNINNSQFPISKKTKKKAINIVTIYKNMAEQCLKPHATIDKNEFLELYATEKQRISQVISLLDPAIAERKRKESDQLKKEKKYKRTRKK